MRRRTRFPIADLVGDSSPEDIAVDLGVTARTVQRWIETGLDWEQADSFACKVLGYHPLTVFGPEWGVAAEAAAPVQLSLADLLD